MTLPGTTRDLRKGFKKWLGDRGAMIMPEHSEWEVLRFRDAEGVGVIYRNKADRLSFRDGHRCFYCGAPMELGEESIEHLLSLNHGGSNHLANKTLAHVECNARAGSKSLVEKIKLRDELWRAKS